MTDIEKRCKADHDDESDNEGIDYLFDPRKGFELCIAMSVGYRKQVQELKEEIGTLRAEHDRDMTEMRRMLHETKTKLTVTTENYCSLFSQNQGLLTRLQAVEDENRSFIERISALEEENKQMKERLAILEAKIVTK